MKIKEKKWFFSLLGFLIVVIYVLFSSQPLKKELQLLPEWTVNLEDSYLAHRDADSHFVQNEREVLLPFLQGQYLGAVYPSGEIAFIEAYAQRASLSKKYWIPYEMNAKKTLVHSMDGGESFQIKEEGFPFAIDSFLFTFFPGGNSFGSYDAEGQLLWTASQWSPISAFSVSQDAIAVGYIDGNLRLFSADGDLLFSSYPAGSKYEIIYGAVLSSDTQLLASICGLEKQRFVLYTVDGENTKIIHHEYIDGEKTRARFMQFNADMSKVFYDVDQGLAAFDIKTKTTNLVPLTGNICSMQNLSFENIIAVLSKKNNSWYLSLLDAYDEIIASFSFTAESASLFTYENALFLGRDASLSKMELVRK